MTDFTDRVQLVLARAQVHLRSFEEVHPRLQRRVRALRDAEIPRPWPNWCYLPATAALELVIEDRGPRPGYSLHSEALATLSAWRVTKGVYLFDQNLFDAVFATGIDRVPAGALRHFPEWTLLIPIPAGWTIEDQPWFAVYAGLDWSPSRAEPRLLISLDVDVAKGVPHLRQMHVPLRNAPLSECIAMGLEPVVRSVRREQAAGWREHLAYLELQQQQWQVLLPPVLALLCYLCSRGADVRDPSSPERVPRYPSPVRTKRGGVLIPASTHTVWEVGFRIGAELRAGLTLPGGSGAPAAASHASPLPHWRRGHWHIYWYGPRNSEDRQSEALWLPPIPVGIESGDVVPTVRRIRSL